ncbi:MAG: single-stranded-DNA-specific exonuclease RecJ, partial [Gammaproteobacteria bacterium]|nr:single-stranded-DNA-specific exonuclease RecJ [Gammaproteobacteria bacterium]
MTISIVRRDIKTHDLPADLHPVIAKVYASRNLCTADELERSLKFLHSYESLKDIDKAVAILSDALQSNKKILIVADFDADGATSCTLAIRALRMMGLSRVEYL